MQGSFAPPASEEDEEDDDENGLSGMLGGNNVDWTRALQPALDPETDLHHRRERMAVEYQTAIHASRPPAAGVAPPPLPPDPLKPSASFTAKGRRYFILEGFADRGVPARAGQLGHYLVPMVIPLPPVGAVGPADARPYPGNQRPMAPAPAVPAGAPTHPAPDMAYCLEGRDFVCGGPGADFLEVGMEALKAAVADAEERDLGFARTIQGFQNVALTVVWDCLDPDFNPADRPAVLTQFLGKYLDRFYSQVDVGNIPDVGDVSGEALHMHKSFCQQWVQKHYKSLTPLVTAAAENLAGEFYPALESILSRPGGRKLTRMELARLFMRHPELAPEFATCLHYFMTCTEQTRGNRNASYKQMNTISMQKALSYNRLAQFLASKSGLIGEAVKQVLAGDHEYAFHPLVVDWYGIAGQMPAVHKRFEDTPGMLGLLGTGRRGQAGALVPPWRVGRLPG